MIDGLMADIKELKRRLERLEAAEVPGNPLTFTPTFQGSGTAGSWTYSVQSGFYTRIANRIFFNLSINAATRPTPPTGNARIIGLPFASNASANSHSPVVIDSIDNMTLSATIVQLTARVPPGQSYIELIETTGTAPAVASFLAATAFSATAFLRLSGHYML